VGTFPPDDLAVIHVEGGRLPAATLGDSSMLHVGDIVLALGNPLGLQSSVTNGIVSALGRTVSESSGVALPDLIQTSAPINPGNSGGALVDLSGQVVGIPTLAAIDPENQQQASGIGFAIPSNTVKEIAGQLISDGRVVQSGRAYLGLQLTTLSSGAGVLVMAARFLAAGHPVYGEDRDRQHADELVRDGLQWCDTPRELAETAEVVFTSVPDDDVLEAVASGADGLLAGLIPDQIWVDMSTVSPHKSREIAERVNLLGAAMLDAPVSGSVPQVQAGTLTIMVGGGGQAYSRVEPILRELGTPTHVGENGQGLVLKLAINISLAVQMLAFSEGLLLATRAGIDSALAADGMTRSPIGSPMLKARAPLVFDLPEQAWFDVGLMRKDIELALDAGRQLGVPLPTAAVADELLTEARVLGYEHRDIAAFFEVLERTASLASADE
jgi:3-hydroxyisobutyrate dehydrogenase-like beta-hydroxyacid dehydrogenase